MAAIVDHVTRYFVSCKGTDGVPVDVSRKLINEYHERETSTRCLLPVVQLASECNRHVRSKTALDLDICVITFAEPQTEACHGIKRTVWARLTPEHEGYELILEEFLVHTHDRAETSESRTWRVAERDSSQAYYAMLRDGTTFIQSCFC